MNRSVLRFPFPARFRFRRRHARYARVSATRIACVAGTALLVLLPAPAEAHPLGNFTISRFSALEISLDRLGVRQVIDFAEVPTFQELAVVDANRDGEIPASELDAYARMKSTDLLAGIRATTTEEPLRLEVVAARAELRDGEGDLDILRIEIDYSAALPAAETTIRYADLNYQSFQGWKEIIANPEGGQSIVSSTVPRSSISDELQRYPRNMLQDPLEVAAAVVAVEPGEDVAPDPTQDIAEELPITERLARSFTDLVGRDLNPIAVLGAIAIAFGVGVAHALGPGHGKTIMAAYLVGAGGRARHAVLIGSAVSLMHTASVVALGLVTLSLSRLFPTHQVYPWLALISGLLVMGVGIWLFVTRMRGGGHTHSHDHDHSHGHDHHHGHQHHQNDAPTPLSWKGLGVIALSGGLLPSPSALIVLLGAISLHRVAFGVVLVAAFSIGLASALALVGIAVIKARSFMAARWGRTGRVLPLLSSAVVVILGAALTVRALFSF